MTHDLPNIERALDELGAIERAAAPAGLERRVIDRLASPPPVQGDGEVIARIGPRRWKASPLRLAAAVSLGSMVGIAYVASREPAALPDVTLATSAAIEADHLAVLCEWLSSDVELGELSDLSSGTTEAIDDLLLLEGASS